MPALDKFTPIAVIGAGTMGGGIAEVAAAAGHPVLLFDAFEGAHQKAIAGTAKRMESRVQRGKMTAEARDAMLARLQPIDALEKVAPAGLVIEAIIEEAEAKGVLFAALEKVVDARAILATNTSALSVTALAAGLDEPSRFLGLHFFNPAPVLPLVEVVRSIGTAEDALETAVATMAVWGKTPVVCRSTPGFIVNRVARPFYGEALRIVEEGVADAATADAVLTGALGFRMGPFALMDLIGIDVNLAANTGVWEGFAYDPRYAPTLLQREMAASGRHGRKTGRGYFDYGEGAAPAMPAVAPECPAPREVVIRGDLGAADALAERIAASDLNVKRAQGAPAILVDGHSLALTDGRPATIRWHDEGARVDVLFDLARDYAGATHIAIAKADQATEAAQDAAVGLFQALGMAVCVVGDGAGLICLRTQAMIANEAFSAVETGVCEGEALDLAMQKGTNWPEGPLAWADRYGLGGVMRAMENLAANFGTDRYRVQPLLRRLVAGSRAVTLP